MLQHIIISRTDKIGDVILTLPSVIRLREHFPHVRITFLGNSYTKPVLSCAEYIDNIIEWDILSEKTERDCIQIFKSLNAQAILHMFPQKDVAKAAFKAGIPIRAGTSHRLYHWLYCNQLLHFSRKRSDLHEAQLNLKILKATGVDVCMDKNELCRLDLLTRIPVAEQQTLSYIDENRMNIILHPHSKGSAREWPLSHYIELCNLLPVEKYNIIFAGTKDEAEMYHPSLQAIKRSVKDAGGKLSLNQYIALISVCKALVAASTGPLHIAAACGIHAVGIYPPIRPMHPGRWSPIGKNVTVFSPDKACSKCRKSLTCQCMSEITPEAVARFLFTLSAH
jgi:heptosyltransferase III